ncbi:MAG: hypothetical protein WCO56_21700 [Verrucomicrobiota bacterium]
MKNETEEDRNLKSGAGTGSEFKPRNMAKTANAESQKLEEDRVNRMDRIE